MCFSNRPKCLEAIGWWQQVSNSIGLNEAIKVGKLFAAINVACPSEE